MVPECAGIAPTPSRWRHGCSRRRPGLPRYLTAFPVTPGESRLNNRGHEPVQHGSSRISKGVHGAATVVTRFTTVRPGSSNRDEPAP